MSQEVASKQNGLHRAPDTETSRAQNGSTRETEQAHDVTSASIQAQNTLLSFAGSFADDPFWDDMMEFIKEDREKMDAKYDVAE